VDEVREPKGGKGFDWQALDRSKCEDCEVASRVTYVESLQVLIGILIICLAPDMISPRKRQEDYSS
jgi:hypothetical protein